MKKLLLALAILFTGSVVSAQETAAGPNMEVDKEFHDYGTIKQNANGACEFKITNTGTEPLIISNAKGSCGCTVPEWPKQPIMPGKSAVMTVKYDTKRVGPINKAVTITSNAVNSPTKVVRIKGTVQADSTPASTSPVKTPAGAPAGGL